MTRWIGRLLMAAAVAHTVIALVRYQDVVFAIVRAGVSNTVVGDPVKRAVGSVSLMRTRLWLTH